MPDANMSDTQFQLWAVHELYVKPADRNYSIARFCLISGLLDEFFWQAAQCLEKYLKAGLILNGKSIKKFGHDIVELVDCHRDIYKDFAIGHILPSLDDDADLHRPKRVSDFLSRINQFGHPDSRYNMRSFHLGQYDLLYFDYIVFELRRRVGCLDRLIGTDLNLREGPEAQVLNGRKFSDLIVEFPRYQLWRLDVPSGSLVNVGRDFSDVIYRWNWEFERSADDRCLDIPRHLVSPLGGMRNSFLTLLYRRLTNAEHSSSRRKHLRRRTQWILDFIPMDRDAATGFREILARL